MGEEKKQFDRRTFLKTMGVLGTSTVLASDTNDTSSEKTKDKMDMPKRMLGKTGAEVPCIGLGGNRLENQIILNLSMRHGITYWDTSHSYTNGNSELTIGKFIKNNPDAREKLFIVSKASGAKSANDVEKRLQTSLERMNSKHVDLYYGVHGLSEPETLNDELKQWAQSAKKRGLIKYFGFSTHKNMAKCLLTASKLDWIDAIMTSYNYRLMQDEQMQEAVEACHKTGIGLIAMKTTGQRTGRRSLNELTEADKKLTEHFLKKGFTQAQANIKAVLEDRRISVACVGLWKVEDIHSSAMSILDEIKLTKRDYDLMRQHAAATCGGYCAGCADICDTAMKNMPYVSDIMRYLMYHNSYGDTQMARQLFNEIPANIRHRLLNIDYTQAQAACPQKLPIANLIKEAVSKLS